MRCKRSVLAFRGKVVEKIQMKVSEFQKSGGSCSLNWKSVDVLYTIQYTRKKRVQC